MIKNYIKIALRNISRQKIYSLITMSGLIIGLSVFIMFALLSYRTANFDAFHENSDRIHAVVQVLPGGQEGDQHAAITPPPLLPALIGEFPEIEKAARFHPAGRMIVKHQDKVFYETGVRFVDRDFLSIFSFKLIKGEEETALTRANSIVLTVDLAAKYFPDENPMGQILTLDNDTDVVITGVTENVPDNSSIQYDFLVSMATAPALYDWMEDWGINNQASFLLLSEGSDPVNLEAKLSGFINKYYPDTNDAPKSFFLFSLLDFFLRSEGIDNYWNSGQISYISIWIVAVLLLIIACINFMNLSTARYVTRANEVGMRKVVGAHRSQLVKQFLGESTLMALISLPAAILLYDLFRPLFAANFGGIFDIPILENPQVLILILGVALLTGIFAGSYPAFYLSAFKPVLVVKNKLTSGKKGSRFRKVLVVFQFTFSVILVLMTVISIKQSEHNLKVDLGFNRTNILAVTISSESRDKMEILKNVLGQNKDILSLSASNGLPVEWNTARPVLPEGFREEDTFNMNSYGIDYGFLKMLEIDILQGRSFSRNFSDMENLILNESAVKRLQWEDPIGKQITIGNKKGTVIGVAKDYHFKSIVLEKISPAVFYLGADELNYLFIKYATPESLAGVTESVKEKWNVIAPDLPFEYITLKDAFNNSFQGDKTSEMTGTLGALAIFLSCLGLFGLSSFSVERRIKEIGIRKVLGASVSGIVRMLTKDFMKLVAIANLIAIPSAYFMMNALINFLYAYPVRIGAGIFIITAALALLIAFLTVSLQTIKSALMNPVNSLKYE